MKRLWWTLAGGAAFCAFRMRWWRRVHYQTLLGRTYAWPDIVQHHCHLLDAIHHVFEAHDVPWWMDFGTLLGAWRNGAYIPWDDDADICVLHDDHARILNLAGEFPHPYRLVTISRVWSVDKVIPGLARLWPCRTFLRLLDTRTQLYVDIFEAAALPGTRLHTLPLSLMHPTRTYLKQPFVYPRNLVFPLTPLPFEGRIFPAPAQAEAYLKLQFGPDLSEDHVLDPRTGRYVPLRPHRWRI